MPLPLFIKKIKLQTIALISLATEERTHPYTTRFFRKAIYLWFLVNTLILFPAREAFWGSDSFIPSIDKEIVNSAPLINLLSLDGMGKYYIVFICFQIVLLVLGILCVYPRTVSILIYLLSVNLDNKAYVILDGGNNLMQLMLIYLIFMNPQKPGSRPDKPTFLRYLDNAFSNAGFQMARFQLVIVYLVSGLGKVAGELWQNGTALYYTLNIDEYTHPIAKNLVTHYPLLTVMGTYLTLLYQVSFPWLVWNRKLRPYLLSIGTLIHLQISFVMGLLMFGFAISFTYLSFTPDSAAKKILSNINHFFEWLLRKLQLCFSLIIYLRQGFKSNVKNT